MSRRRVLGSGFILSLYHLVIFNYFLYMAKCDTNCQFPKEWNGEWFERGEKETVKIYNGTMSTKGSCVQHDPDFNKYILRDPVSKCYTCVVIHQKHINFLQYKKSLCKTRMKSMSNLCNYITGDHALLSIFRVNADPVPCPFSGRFTLSFNIGHRDCTKPKSSLDPCTDTSKLHFKFHACHEDPKSESSYEQLQCLASWTEGPDNYIAGKMFRNKAKTDSERYRCYVYAASEDGSRYEIAESADASCDGILLSPLIGARTMKLIKVEENDQCQYPSWVSSMSEWHMINGDDKYFMKDQNTSIVVVDKLSHPQIHSSIKCIRTVRSTDQSVRFVVHVTAGCDNGFRCMEFFFRDTYIIQYKQGAVSTLSRNACSDMYYDPNTAQSITLKAHTSKVISRSPGGLIQAITDIKYPTKSSVAAADSESPLTMKCPYHGEYIAKETTIIRNSGLKPGCNTSLLSVGCHSDHSMEINAKCPASSSKDRFYCHGNWTDGRVHHVIASHADTKDNYCFSYIEEEGGLVFFAKHGSCKEETSAINSRSVQKTFFPKKSECSAPSDASSSMLVLKKLLLIMLSLIFFV